MQDNGGMKPEKKTAVKHKESDYSCLAVTFVVVVAIVCGTVLGIAWIIWG